MRIFKYKCPIYKDKYGCRYPDISSKDIDPELDKCECGMTYEKSKTIWEKIGRFYRKNVPSKWQLNNLYWRIRSHFFRYTTIKSRYLNHEWCDRDAVLIYTIFEVAQQFVEGEIRPERRSSKYWDEMKKVNPEFYNSWKETIELVKWFEKWHDTDYPYNLTQKEIEQLEEENHTSSFEINNRFEKEKREKAKRLIDISPYWWT